MLVAAVFLIPSTPEDDGHIRGAVIVAGFLPLAFGVLFLYYLVLSIKVNRPFKFALLVQTAVILPFSAFIFYVASKEGGVLVGVLNLIYTLGFFSVVGVSGAWAWSKSKKT